MFKSKIIVFILFNILLLSFYIYNLFQKYLIVERLDFYYTFTIKYISIFFYYLK